MRTQDAIRQLEKIQTLIEDLTEKFPEEGAGLLGHAFEELQTAGRSIGSAIDFLGAGQREDNEEL